MITPARWKKPVLFTCGILLIVALGFWLWLPSNGLNAARKFIPWKFGNVTHITPEELNKWLKDSNRTAPRLWDIRRPDEFTVSHLPNARHVPPETSDSKLKEILKDTDHPIVVYCAVGYRSAKMAQRLMGLGHANVINLEGAIFAWSTEGNALKGSNKVHPFNTMGRRMLRDDLEAD